MLVVWMILFTGGKCKLVHSVTLWRINWENFTRGIRYFINYAFEEINFLNLVSWEQAIVLQRSFCCYCSIIQTLLWCALPRLQICHWTIMLCSTVFSNYSIYPSSHSFHPIQRIHFNNLMEHYFIAFSYILIASIISWHKVSSKLHVSALISGSAFLSSPGDSWAGFCFESWAYYYGIWKSRV